MNFLRADCGLSLKVVSKANQTLLKFTQSPLSGELATIPVDLSGDEWWQAVAEQQPHGLSRFIFWVTSGLGDFEHLLGIVAEKEPYHSAHFYRCLDRKKRERFFAEIHEAGSETGASFIVKKEDFERVRAQLKEVGAEF